MRKKADRAFTHDINLNIRLPHHPHTKPSPFPLPRQISFNLLHTLQPINNEEAGLPFFAVLSPITLLCSLIAHSKQTSPPSQSCTSSMTKSSKTSKPGKTHKRSIQFTPLNWVTGGHLIAVICKPVGMDSEVSGQHAVSSSPSSPHSPSSSSSTSPSSHSSSSSSSSFISPLTLIITPAPSFHPTKLSFLDSRS